MQALLIPKILDLLVLGFQVAPDIIAAGKLEIELMNSATPPSPEQQAQIDAGLDAAHATLQAAQPS